MKRDFHATQEQREAQLAARADELRAALRILPPDLIASRSGSTYDTSREEFHIPFWGVERVLSFPELTSETISTFHQTLLLYYLITADGAAQTGKWVSFADLPDGRTYNAAFQGYTGNELVKRFGNSLDEFHRACLACGGSLVEVGDASYIFQALPRIPLLATYWLGDDEFPSSCKILFDASAAHYMTLEGCAILGSALTQKIIKTAMHSV
jgi:hypothetical protein